MSDDNGSYGIPAENRPSDGLVGIDHKTDPIINKTASGNLVLTPQGSEILAGFLGLWLKEVSDNPCAVCGAEDGKYCIYEGRYLCADCNVWEDTDETE